MALLDYLSERREEIEAQMKALKSELAEIRIAEAALRGEPSAKKARVAAPGAVIRAGTIKDWIMKALTAFGTGLETDAVIEAIRKMGGPIVERSSITPQLSRLKSAGLIMHDGKHWRLPTEEEKEVGQTFEEMFEATARKNETPDAATSGASDDEEDLVGSLA